MKKMNKKCVFLGLALACFFFFTIGVKALDCVGEEYTISKQAGFTPIIGFGETKKPISNKYYYRMKDDKIDTIFCVDPHLNGPAGNYCNTSLTPSNASNALIHVYNTYQRDFKREKTINVDAYRQFNAVIRLIYEHYGLTHDAICIGGSNGNTCEKGTQYGAGSTKVYTNTVTVIDKMRSNGYKGNRLCWDLNCQNSQVEEYKKTAKELGISANSILSSLNDNLGGKGYISNIISRYIDAIEHGQADSYQDYSKNIKITANKVSSVLEEVNENYVTKVGIEIDGMPAFDKASLKNIKIRATNSYGTIIFDSNNINANPLNQTATKSHLNATITIPKSAIQGKNVKSINFSFDLTYDYEDKTGLTSGVYEACQSYQGKCVTSNNDVRQRMLVFKNTPTSATEAKNISLTVTIEIPICQIKDKEDGTKEYYDLNGTLINKGSEEANLEEYNRVCKLCFQSPELDPNSPEFNKEMFDKRGCCYMFDPDDINADPGHKEYYNKFCARMCYVTPELNPDSYEFDQSAFEEECCDMPPTNAAQLEHYNTYCGRKDPCTPTIDLPYCSNASSSTSTIKESDDWDRCIFNNKDVAGNPYNISGYENNPYCKIACKEEYEITYPGRINNIRAGQYFVLTTGISGKRTCKTTEIRNDKFESDVEDLIDDVLEAYNDWIYYYKAAAATASTSSSSCKSTGREEVKCTQEQIDAKTCTPVSACDAEEKTTCSKVSFTWTYTTYSIINGRLVPDTKTETKSTGGTNPSACSCTCDSVTYPSDYKAERDRLKVILDNKINALNNAFNYIRSCSSFNNNFNFDPDISLTYEEDYYMNMIRQLPNGNSFIPSEDAEIKTDVSHYVGTQNYGDSSQTKTVRKIVCNANGCSFINETVPKNTRIEKVATVDQTMYKPATVFYSKLPTGEMKCFQNGNKPNPEKDYVKVGQVFPIAMTTEEGTYNYTITYGNLGQYNDDNSTGRITGYSNSVYEALGYSNEYVCNYNIVEDICLDCPPNEDRPTSGGGTLPGGFAYFYRPISLYDVFPNSKVDTSGKDYLSDKVSRTIGKNWTSVKGVFTQKRIEENNAEAYGEAEYSFTLTPANMMAIRNYNKTHQYNDFNLVCNSDGIDCTSNFLRDGLQEGYFSDAKLNDTFVHANGDGNTPKGLEICKVGETNSLSCVGPSWK